MNNCQLLIESLSSSHPELLSFYHAASSITSENIYIAGGSVRNWFIKENAPLTQDIDLFVSETGFKILQKMIISMQQGRVGETSYEGLRWFPNPEESFHYDIIPIHDFIKIYQSNNIFDVLNQFDITANTLAFDLKTGEFYNPLHGLEHIQQKELRAVRFDFPDSPISEKINVSHKSLLWYRCVVYAKKLNFFIEPITAQWLKENNHFLKEHLAYLKENLKEHISYLRKNSKEYTS